MVDSKYITDEYKSSKIGFGAIIKDLEILRLVPDHLKTKKIRKHPVKEVTVPNKVCS